MSENKKPNVIRAISTDGAVACCVIDSSAICGYSERIHRTSPTVTTALGRLLTAASMMGCMLKGKKDALTIKIAGDGEIGSLISVASSDGNVKGYPCNAVLEKERSSKCEINVAKAVGKGTLYVIRDLGLKEPYMGQIPLVSGEIAEDITAYYAISEQIPTVCGLGVHLYENGMVRSAGGFLIQLLPGADEDTISKVEKIIEKAKPVTTMLEEKTSLEDIAKNLLNGFEIEILDGFETAYTCDCSRQRVERALLTTGKEQLQEIIETDGQAQLDCHFCFKKYKFTKDDLEQLVKQMS